MADEPINRKRKANQDEDEPWAKKIKSEDSFDGETRENLIKEQDEEYHELLNFLETHTKLKDWIHILRCNHQAIPMGRQEVRICTLYVDRKQI